MTSPRTPESPASPSWAGPIAAGAALTSALCLPAILQNMLWLPICGCSLFAGAPLGMLPAALALRKDPYMGASSGFAVAFISIGLGTLVPAATTLLRGFRLDDAVLEQMRQVWTESGVSKGEIDQMIDAVQVGGPVMVVVAAAATALSAGVIGAVVAGWTDRRRRHSPPPQPPVLP